MSKTAHTRHFLNASVLIVGVSGAIIGVDQRPDHIALPSKMVPASTVSAASDGDNAAEPAPPAKEIASAADSINWQADFTAAVELAREENKTLWVHVVHDGCGACVTLAKTVFPDPAIVSRVDQRLIAVQVNRFARGGAAVVAAYRAGGTDPVDLFVFPSGKFLRYVGAPQSVEAMLLRFDGAEKFAAQAKWPSYPTDGNQPWTLNGKTVGVEHLLEHSKHRGKFNPAWLASLSAKSLAELHADDHESTVRWEFVPPPQL